MRETSESGERPAERRVPDESGAELRARLLCPASERAAAEPPPEPQSSVETTEDAERPLEANGVPESEYRVFETAEDGHEYGRRQWSETVDSLSPRQRTALFDYTREMSTFDRVVEPDARDYTDVNRGLRFPPMRADVAERVQRIDEALALHPVEEAIEVTRATDLDHFQFDIGDPGGAVVSEAAYLSASLGPVAPAFESKEAVVHLKVPPGTPALYLSDGVSAFGPGEREVLLGRDLRWRVERTALDPDTGKWHIYGKVIDAER